MIFEQGEDDEGNNAEEGRKMAAESFWNSAQPKIRNGERTNYYNSDCTALPVQCSLFSVQFRSATIYLHTALRCYGVRL